MSGYNKAVGAGIGGGIGLPVSVIAIWLLTDQQFVGIEMPDEVKVAFGSVITIICSVVGTIRSPANLPSVVLSLFMLGAVLTLQGCNAIPGYSQYKMAGTGVVDDAILERMEYNDKKAQLIQVLNCDISIGAYARMPESNVKRGVGLICGLDNGASPDLMTTVWAMALLNATRDGQPMTSVLQQLRALNAPTEEPVDLTPLPALD